tara:strand:+ start:2469 stop:2885 length:417 start_codon:yes stop_codon:yes gene_type:complete
MYYKYLDHPVPPQELLLDLHSVRQLPNIFGGATKNYTIHECPDELAEWLRGIFPEYTKFRYQTLTRDIPCHVDRGREIAINYLIDAGGTDVSTVWYSDEFGDKLEETIVEAGRWHQLQVDQWHTVHGITGDRFALTIA